MKPPAIHALEHDQMAAGIGNSARNGYAGFACLGDGSCHHPFGALIGETFGIGDIHGG